MQDASDKKQKKNMVSIPIQNYCCSLKHFEWVGAGGVGVLQDINQEIVKSFLFLFDSLETKGGGLCWFLERQPSNQSSIEARWLKFYYVTYENKEEQVYIHRIISDDFERITIYQRLFQWNHVRSKPVFLTKMPSTSFIDILPNCFGLKYQVLEETRKLF